MKKFLVPSLLMLLAVGLSQPESKAGVSIGISIGDHHRHRPPVVISHPPVCVERPPVVVVRPRHGHDRYDSRRVYVRECDRYHGPRHDCRDHERHDSRRRSHSHWRR